MTGPTVPAHVLASVDQCRAQLAELVAGVREHADAQMCVLPALCPGGEVGRVVHQLRPNRQRALLYLALAELAALDYGLPVFLTDAAVAALDDKPKRRWWSWRR